MKPFDRKLKEIEELVNDNCHSEALIEIAGFFFLVTGNVGFKKLEEAFDWINRQIEKREGRGCLELTYQRNDLSDSMFGMATKLGYGDTAEQFKSRL